VLRTVSFKYLVGDNAPKPEKFVQVKLFHNDGVTPLSGQRRTGLSGDLRMVFSAAFKKRRNLNFSFITANYLSSVALTLSIQTLQMSRL